MNGRGGTCSINKYIKQTKKFQFQNFKKVVFSGTRVVVPHVRGTQVLTYYCCTEVYTRHTRAGDHWCTHTHTSNTHTISNQYQWYTGAHQCGHM